jgi:hypothetical protein
VVATPDKDIRDFRIIHDMFVMGRALIGGMILGGVTGAVVGHYSAKRQFESMTAARAQQSRLEQAQAQAAQAEQSAQAAQAAMVADQDKKEDIAQELEKLASLRQKGILSEEEFQQMKARKLSSL